MATWLRFLPYLLPSSTRTEARVRFAMLDLSGSGKIDALDFLQIRSQLEMRLHQTGAQQHLPQRSHMWTGATR
jgi:hypothetical protein